MVFDVFFLYSYGALRDLHSFPTRRSSDLVTIQGVLDLSRNGSYLFVSNGITLTGAGGTGPGSVLMTGGNSDLYSNGPKSSHNATANVGGSSDTDILREFGSGGTLTLGNGL